MKYWIIAVPRERLKRCIDVKTFGLTRKFLLGHMTVGDPVACYVTKEKKIAALGKVTASYFLDDKNIFQDPKIYPDRINFEAHWLSEEHEIDFMEVLGDMQFVKNPAYWTAHFNGGIVEITKHDWQVIHDRSGLEIG